MYVNIKLVEEFEASLKSLLTEDGDMDDELSFRFEKREDDMKQGVNFNADDDDEYDDEDDEILDESFILGESASSDNRNMKKIINELESELDEDDDEDFDGDGEDDIDPDELDNLNLGADDEIVGLSDEEEEDKIDEEIVLEDINLDIDDELLIEGMNLDIDTEDYLSEDFDFGCDSDYISEDVDDLDLGMDYISEDLDFDYLSEDEDLDMDTEDYLSEDFDLDFDI